MTTMYNSYDQRRMNIVLEDYDGQMIPGEGCGRNFLTFVLQLRKNPENLNQEIDSTGFEPGPAR